eukprot:5072182-Pyramimonas_sp.AAC.1
MRPPHGLRAPPATCRVPAWRRGLRFPPAFVGSPTRSRAPCSRGTIVCTSAPAEELPQRTPHT